MGIKAEAKDMKSIQTIDLWVRGWVEIENGKRDKNIMNRKMGKKPPHFNEVFWGNIFPFYNPEQKMS